MRVKNKFDLGEVVLHRLLKYEPDKYLQGIVTTLVVSGEDSIEYGIVWENESQSFSKEYEIESKDFKIEEDLDDI